MARHSKMLTTPAVDLLVILLCRISVWGEAVWFSEEQRDCACWSETWEYNDCGPLTEAIEGKSNWLWLSLQSLWSTEGFTHSDQVVQVNIWQHGRARSAALTEILSRMSFHICPEWIGGSSNKEYHSKDVQYFYIRTGQKVLARTGSSLLTTCRKVDFVIHCIGNVTYSLLATVMHLFEQIMGSSPQDRVQPGSWKCLYLNIQLSEILLVMKTTWYKETVFWRPLSRDRIIRSCESSPSEEKEGIHHYRVTEFFQCSLPFFYLPVA